MAHTGIYATSAECIFKMGNGYDSTNVDEDRINELSLQAENFINVLCHKVLAADAAAFTALPIGTKYLLSEAASNLVAVYGISYNILDYNSSREAENLINLNWQRFNQIIKLLNEDGASNFVLTGT